MTEQTEPNEDLYGIRCTPEDAAVVLIPVPWDATCSYHRGTACGPQAILAASPQLDLYDIEVGDPASAGISMLSPVPELSDWNREAAGLAKAIVAQARAEEAQQQRELARVNQLSRKVQAEVRREAATWIERGKLVGVIGGEHSVPLGAMQSVGEACGEFGVLHIDAHADLRHAYQGFEQSHASIMSNALAQVKQLRTLVQVGVRDLCTEELAAIRGSSGRVKAFFDADLANDRLRGVTWAQQCETIVQSLPRQVYVSLDIDGLDPSLCPHTGTPVPGGLSFHQICYLLRELVARERRVVGFDLCEVAPGPDGDEWDGNVGARVLYKLIGWALKSRGQL